MRRFGCRQEGLEKQHTSQEHLTPLPFSQKAFEEEYIGGNRWDLATWQTAMEKAADSATKAAADYGRQATWFSLMGIGTGETAKTQQSLYREAAGVAAFVARTLAD